MYSLYVAASTDGSSSDTRLLDARINVSPDVRFIVFSVQYQVLFSSSRIVECLVSIVFSSPRIIWCLVSSIVLCLVSCVYSSFVVCSSGLRVWAPPGASSDTRLLDARISVSPDVHFVLLSV